MKNYLFQLCIALFLILANQSTAQQVLKTENNGYTSSNDLIIPFRESYAILGRGYEDQCFLSFYNPKHELIKKMNVPKFAHPNIAYQTDSLAILKVKLDFCDYELSAFFVVEENGKFKKTKFGNSQSVISPNGNIFQYDLTNKKIDVRKFKDSLLLKQIDVSMTGGIADLINYSGDTILIFNIKNQPYFVSLTNGLEPIKLFWDGNIESDNDIIDLSDSEFFLQINGTIYDKKNLKSIGKISNFNDSFDNLKKINGTFYHIISNPYSYSYSSVKEYKFDSTGVLNLFKTYDSNFSNNQCDITDMLSFKGKWLMSGRSYTAYSPLNSKLLGYNDVLMSLDSLSEKIAPRFDMNFTIPTQKEPEYDKKCKGYLFDNFELNIENLGKDTLNRFAIKGQSYGGLAMYCYLPTTEEWSVKDISIPPNTHKTLTINNFCVHGFSYNKDSTNFVCLRVTAPNGSIDANIKDNASCITFKRSKNEVRSTELPEGSQINVWTNNELLFLNGNLDFAKANLTLFDLAGKICFQTTFDALPQQIQMPEHLPQGMYICHINIENQWLVNRKLILKN